MEQIPKKEEQEEKESVWISILTRKGKDTQNPWSYLDVGPSDLAESDTSGETVAPTSQSSSLSHGPLGYDGATGVSAASPAPRCDAGVPARGPARVLHCSAATSEAGKPP